MESLCHGISQLVVVCIWVVWNWAERGRVSVCLYVWSDSNSKSMSFRFAKLNIYTHIDTVTPATPRAQIHSLTDLLAVQPRHSKQIITIYTKRVCIFFVLLLLFVSFSFSSSADRATVYRYLSVQVWVSVWVYGIHWWIRCVCAHRRSVAQTSSVDACVLELEVTQWNLMKT